MNIWCLLFGHYRVRELRDREAGDEGWPCIETCVRCGHEWGSWVPEELLLGDAEDEDPGGRMGPWEVYFCHECGFGPLPMGGMDGVYTCGICWKG